MAVTFPWANRRHGGPEVRPDEPDLGARDIHGAAGPEPPIGPPPRRASSHIQVTHTHRNRRSDIHRRTRWSSRRRSQLSGDALSAFY